MTTELVFRLLYRLKQKNDVEKHIHILNKGSEAQFEIQSIDRYWKDESLFECNVRIALAGATKEECIYNTLKIAHRFSMTWVISGPLQNGTSNVYFDGIFDETKEGKPLRWAHFILDLKEL